MERKNARFEELIGNVDVFGLMLDGAFRDWKGTYDVLVADTDEYLFEAKQLPNFRPFCGKLRSQPAGEKLCLECDRKVRMGWQLETAQAQASGPRATIYMCHAGLKDVAIPIMIGQRLIATVFCGQVRSTQDTEDQIGLEQAQHLESDLGFAKGELVGLWQKIPRMADRDIQATVDRVENLVNYVVQTGHERLELERAHAKDRRRLQESLLIEKAARDLSQLADTWEQFWDRLEQVLRHINEVIGASAAMLIVSSNHVEADAAARFVPKAVAGLPAEIFKAKAYTAGDALLSRALAQSGIDIVPFEAASDHAAIGGSLLQDAPELAAHVDEVVVAPLSLDDQYNGVLLFFLNTERDTAASLPVQEEKTLLRPLTFLVSASYHNCSLYQQRKQELEKRRQWLRHLTHQLVSPLHGLQGYAENARNRLTAWGMSGLLKPNEWSEERAQRWQDELRRWENAFDGVVSAANYAARLAHNLSWTVYGKAESLDLKRVHDVGGLLIRCARDFQGIARERGLRKVNVETDSVQVMNDRLFISDNFFRQAVGNLLDNAVKYSDQGSSINVLGEIRQNQAIMRVINYGIPLRAAEVEEIFKEYYRTTEAKRVNQTGTGIGLLVARQIVELHGGSLTALASVKTRRGWRTQFIITLPLHPLNGNQEATS